MGESVEASGYIVVKGNRRYGAMNGTTGMRNVADVRLDRMLTNRPASLAADEVAVRVKIVLPVEAFDPPSPSVVVVVPMELVQQPEITVEATE